MLLVRKAIRQLKQKTWCSVKKVPKTAAIDFVFHSNKTETFFSPKDTVPPH